MIHYGHYGNKALRTEPPRLCFYGQPKNLMHVTDNWNVLNAHSHLESQASVLYSALKVLTLDVFQTTVDSVHRHTEDLELAMPWMPVGQYVARAGIDLTTASIYVGAGHMIVPHPYEVVVPYIRADDNGNGMALTIDLRESADMANLKVRESLTALNVNNEVMHGSTIDVSSFAVDADGLRHIFFTVTGQMVASTGVFYEISFRLPRVDGIDTV